MPPENATSPRGIYLGGLAGGMTCALARGGVTFYNLRDAAGYGLVASLPSAGIGFLCGAIAGAFCRGWLGAFLGAMFSAVVFGLFVVPFAMICPVDGVADLTWPYFLQKAAAGAIGGGIGGFAGQRIVASQRRRGLAKD